MPILTFELNELKSYMIALSCDVKLNLAVIFTIWIDLGRGKYKMAATTDTTKIGNFHL